MTHVLQVRCVVFVRRQRVHERAGDGGAAGTGAPRHHVQPARRAQAADRLPVSHSANQRSLTLIQAPLLSNFRVVEIYVISKSFLGHSLFVS